MFSPACKKVSMETNLTGTWTVSKYFKNGVDSTANFNMRFFDYAITFFDDHDFAESYKSLGVLPINNTGSWELTTKLSELKLVTATETRVYTINNLTASELDMENSEERFLMSPK